ncbi:hypothetical protein NDU88_011600 [Pleurodeles waltl]|uniref:Uncharacterized protein n=1 Tax=Pleurodeles waltl TaxID=8319 RepID=A0AAV7PZB2_PLEWA|nr:hypothetical protein NDU88_011600 [Pleurodeles waltl]
MDFTDASGLSSPFGSSQGWELAAAFFFSPPRSGPEGPPKYFGRFLPRSQARAATNLKGHLRGFTSTACLRTGLLLARLNRWTQREPRGLSVPPPRQRHHSQACCKAATRPRRRVDPRRSPVPGHTPPGAATGLTSARPLCTLCSSALGHTLPEAAAGLHVRPPALRSTGAGAAVSRPACVSSQLLWSLRRSRAAGGSPGAPLNRARQAHARLHHRMRQ